MNSLRFSLASLLGAVEPSAPKRNPQKEGNKSRGVSYCPCPRPSWPPAVPQDGWTLALPPALHSGITLGARPPYHLSSLSVCPEEPAPLFSSLETRDTPSGTAEDTQVLATRDPETQPHLGTHTCTGRYLKTQPLSLSLKHPPHTHTQVLTHPPTRTRAHTHTFIQTHTRTHKCTLEGTTTLRYHRHTGIHIHTQPWTQRIADIH